MRVPICVCWAVGLGVSACGNVQVGDADGTHGGSTAAGAASGGVGSGGVSAGAGDDGISAAGDEAGGACGAFSPGRVPEFEGCGLGWPFGLWRATSLEVSGFELGVRVGGVDYDAIRYCPTQVLAEPTFGTFLLELDPDFNVRMSADRSPFTFQVSNACVREGTGGPSCTSLEGLDCRVDDCDVCTCTSPTPPGVATGTFQILDQAFLLALGEETPKPIDYCVRDDQLHFRFHDGQQLTFEPVQRLGLSEDCYPLTSDECAKTAGCNWSANRCTGKATNRCKFDDYGVKPGCGLLPANATCGGKTKPECASYTSEDVCLAVAGCQGGPGCRGTSSCSAHDGNPAACETTVGCYNSGDLCKGELLCGYAIQETTCKSYSGCTWKEFVCKGAPMQCVDLGVEECDQTAGCAIDLGE